MEAYCDYAHGRPLRSEAFSQFRYYCKRPLFLQFEGNTCSPQKECISEFSTLVILNTCGLLHGCETSLKESAIVINYNHWNLIWFGIFQFSSFLLFLIQSIFFVIVPSSIFFKQILFSFCIRILFVFSFCISHVCCLRLQEF